MISKYAEKHIKGGGKPKIADGSKMFLLPIPDVSSSPTTFVLVSLGQVLQDRPGPEEAGHLEIL